jgi:hypothetical protein
MWRAPAWLKSKERRLAIALSEENVQRSEISSTSPAERPIHLKGKNNFSF